MIGHGDGALLLATAGVAIGQDVSAMLDASRHWCVMWRVCRDVGGKRF